MVQISMIYLSFGLFFAYCNLPTANLYFDRLYRQTLLNADDAVPANSAYYLLRKRIVDHEKAGNENLLDVVFTQVTKKQCIDFEVSGKRIRMDSKLLGSNIARLTRYEVIHETFRLFHKEVKQSGKITETPIAVLQKRNNVEASLFQLAYHFPNAKSSRGLAWHQMWANTWCLW